MPTDSITLAIILALAAVITYRASFLKNRKVFRLSLQQIIQLFVLPGSVFVLLNSYIRNLTSLPPSPYALLPDSLVTSLTYLAAFYTYGGVAIHTASKTLSETRLRHDTSDAAQLIHYLHLTFSHNLTYSGSFLFVTGIVFLELNHLPVSQYSRWLSPVLRGLALGAAFILSFVIYTRSDDSYSGRRWSDLKFTFLVGWLSLVTIAYAVIKTDVPLKHYQLLLPALTGLAVINLLYFFLVLRHARRKNWHKKLLDKI